MVVIHIFGVMVNVSYPSCQVDRDKQPPQKQHNKYSLAG